MAENVEFILKSRTTKQVRLFACLGVLACFSIFSCKVSTKTQKDNDFEVDPNANLLIYIQQFPAKGKVPVYTASFYTGQLMEYEGVSRMPLLGAYDFFLPKDFAKNLIFEAVKLNLKLVPDSSAIPEGEQKVKLHIVMSGKEKTIVASAQSGDPIFRQYLKMLQSEVRAMVTEQQGRKRP